MRLSNLDKSLLFVAVIGIACLPILSCAKQQMAKNWGGEYEVHLPPCKKLLNLTWKESNLWVLTRPMVWGEVADKYELIEDSAFGIAEGKILIQESVCK